jgi:hypothetical protein
MKAIIGRDQQLLWRVGDRMHQKGGSAHIKGRVFMTDLLWQHSARPSSENLISRHKDDRHNIGVNIAAHRAHLSPRRTPRDGETAVQRGSHVVGVSFHRSRKSKQGVIRKSGLTIDNHSACEHETPHDCRSRRTHATTLWDHVAASEYETDGLLPQCRKSDSHRLNYKVSFIASDGICTLTVDFYEDTFVFSHHRDEFVVNV